MLDHVTFIDFGLGLHNIYAKHIYIYIDWRPTNSQNIATSINSTQLGTTKNPDNCIFDACEGNWVVVCEKKH